MKLYFLFGVLIIIIFIELFYIFQEPRKIPRANFSKPELLTANFLMIDFGDYKMQGEPINTAEAAERFCIENQNLVSECNQLVVKIDGVSKKFTIEEFARGLSFCMNSKKVVIECPSHTK